MQQLPSLKSGDTIGVFAPSSRIAEERFEAGANLLRERGYHLKIHEQTYKSFNQSAGSFENKARAYRDLLNDQDVKVIMAAAGGNRVSHVLDRLTDHTPAKALVGFSDVTNLHCLRYKQAKLPAIFGPTVQSLTRNKPEQLDYLAALLEGGTPDYPLDTAAAFRTGDAEGVLLGGTLAMLCSLCGTQYMPDFTGAILYLEDVNEELSRIDRMLWQLRQALPFEKLAGVIFGEFVNCKDEGATPFGFHFEDLVREHTEGLEIPVIINAPFGHGENFFSLPFGTRAQLSAGKKNTLHLLEAVTKA